MEKILNATFITLITNKIGALNVKDYRPISLVNEVYKIISKVLANYLGQVLGRVFLRPQNALLKGRQTLDLILILNECLVSKLKSKELGVLCKMDMEKVIMLTGLPTILAWKVWIWRDSAHGLDIAF